MLVSFDTDARRSLRERARTVYFFAPLKTWTWQRLGGKQTGEKTDGKYWLTLNKKKEKKKDFSEGAYYVGIRRDYNSNCDKKKMF